MKWDYLIQKFKNQAIIEPLLLEGNPEKRPKLRVQIARWVKLGRLIKVRSGVYLVRDSYKNEPADRQYIATFAVRPSYISLDYALSIYGLIPEHVPPITLLTTRRPQRLNLPPVHFIYKHISPKHFWGYQPRGEKNRETFIAEPEKALLDYFYFEREKISLSFFEDSMRLQNTEILDFPKLMDYAERFKSPKIFRAAKLLCKFAKKNGGLKSL